MIKLYLLAGALALGGCTTSAPAGECPERSGTGNAQFMEYRKIVGQNAHVQDDLRIAQFCKSLKEEPSWWDKLWD